jgi:hypothetical protein
MGRFMKLVGLVVILLAPAATSQGDVLHTLTGETPGGWLGFGHSVAGGADVDGDGVPDLVVGGPYENGFLGQALVISGADGSTLLVLQDAEGGHFGNAVALVDDVNGDGVPDVLVGAEQFSVFNQDPGFAELRSGADGSELFHWDGLDGRSQFGDAVAAAGDVDGDGVPDVIVGAPLHDANGLSSDAGMARVFSGDDGSVIRTWFGAGGGDQFGTSVGGVGDVNGDGFDDVIVGAPDAGPGPGSGEVRVFSGANGSTLYSFLGTADFDRCGWSVTGAGDVNDDGTPDFAFGSPNEAGVGSARVHSGADGSLLHLVLGDDALGSFGRDVAGAGDVDGDGYADLIVGAHIAQGTGRARVISGRDGSTIHDLYGGATGDRFGESVTGVGDLDGDGYDDVAVGADQFSNSGPGEVRVVSGKPALVGDVAVISVGAGGTLTLSLDTPPGYAGGFHWIFGSISGFSPGVDLGPVSLPLNWDIYFGLTLNDPGLFPTFLGFLDGNGEATAPLVIPPGLDPLLVGLDFHHAFACRAAGVPDFVSNPSLLELEL